MFSHDGASKSIVCEIGAALSTVLIGYANDTCSMVSKTLIEQPEITTSVRVYPPEHQTCGICSDVAEAQLCHKGSNAIIDTKTRSLENRGARM